MNTKTIQNIMKAVMACSLVAILPVTAVSAASIVDEWTPTQSSSWTNIELTTDSGSSASLVASGLSSNPPFSIANSTYYYTLNSTPTLTLSVDALAGVESITLSIYIAGGETSQFLSEPILNFNAENTTLAVTPSISLTGGALAGNATSLYTYTWDVKDLGASDSFTISWQLGTHVAFDQITLTQATSAIPEPTTYAAIVGGLVLLGVMVARWNRA